ncbi:Mitochondrial import inner membrane translocase subunit TIM44, partial [Lucilia cuprina]
GGSQDIWINAPECPKSFSPKDCQPSNSYINRKFFPPERTIDRNAAIEQTKILEDNPRLNPALCKILVTELIFGRKTLNGESKPVQTVREYRDRLVEALGVLASVIVVNFIICLYVYKAFREDLKPRYVRVNTNLLSMEEALTMLAKEEFRKLELPPFENYEDFLKAIQDLKEEEYMLDMHVDNLLIFHPKNKHYLACHQYTKERKFMLQDKGTCLVAELLHPPVGSTVLDMCAAPGMKTIHTCNVLQNQGIIYSVEQSPERYRILCNMTESAGCKIVQPIKGDALAITPEQCPGVEYILVDPSCTGSGIQNRLSLEPEEKSPERLKKLAGLQIKMLSYAMSTFPDVKRIAYSTCSLYEEENEQVVQKCLQLNPNFKLLSGKKALRNKWRSVVGEELEVLEEWQADEFGGDIETGESSKEPVADVPFDEFEMKESIKKFREEAQKLEQSEALQSARQKFNIVESEAQKSSSILKEQLGSIKEKVSDVLEEAGKTEIAQKASKITEEISKQAKTAKESISEKGEKIGQTSAFQAISDTTKMIKQEMDAQSINSRVYRSPARLRKRKEVEFAADERVVEPNMEAMGVELHKDSKFYQSWEDFKNNNAYVNKVLDWKMKYEESENPVIRASRLLTDKVSDVMGGLFSKTELSETLTELCKIDPNFDQKHFLKDCETDIIPNILEAMVRGDLEILKDWCFESTFNIISTPISQALKAGLYLDSKILDIENIDLAMGKVMEQGPVLIVTFQAQQIMCVRERSSNKVVEGDPEKVMRVNYVWVLCRDPNELNPKAAWRLMELSANSQEQFV